MNKEADGISEFIAGLGGERRRKMLSQIEYSTEMRPLVLGRSVCLKGNPWEELEASR